jgi:hypothetical protein
VDECCGVSRRRLLEHIPLPALREIRHPVPGLDAPQGAVVETDLPGRRIRPEREDATAVARARTGRLAQQLDVTGGHERQWHREGPGRHQDRHAAGERDRGGRRWQQRCRRAGDQHGSGAEQRGDHRRRSAGQGNDSTDRCDDETLPRYREAADARQAQAGEGQKGEAEGEEELHRGTEEAERGKDAHRMIERVVTRREHCGHDDEGGEKPLREPLAEGAHRCEHDDRRCHLGRRHGGEPGRSRGV